MILLPSPRAANIFDIHENGDAKFPRVGAAAEWPGRVREGAWRGVRGGGFIDSELLRIRSKQSVNGLDVVQMIFKVSAQIFRA